MRNAALFGVVLAFASLAFLELVKGGTKLWFTLPKNPSWLDGSRWWVAVTAGAGVLVGVLRRLFRVPAKLAGTVEEIQEQRVEPSTVPALGFTTDAGAPLPAAPRRRCGSLSGRGSSARYGMCLMPMQ
jgi:hypothetical protein